MLLWGDRPPLHASQGEGGPAQLPKAEAGAGKENNLKKYIYLFVFLFILCSIQVRPSERTQLTLVVVWLAENYLSRIRALEEAAKAEEAEAARWFLELICKFLFLPKYKRFKCSCQVVIFFGNNFGIEREKVFGFYCSPRWNTRKEL